MTVKHERLQWECYRKDRNSARDHRIEESLTLILRREEDLLKSVGCIGDQDHDYHKQVMETLARMHGSQTHQDDADRSRTLDAVFAQVYEMFRLTTHSINDVLARLKNFENRVHLDLGYLSEEVANSYAYDLSIAKDSSVSMKSSPGVGDTASVSDNLVDVIE